MRCRIVRRSVGLICNTFFHTSSASSSLPASCLSGSPERVKCGYYWSGRSFRLINMSKVGTLTRWRGNYGYLGRGTTVPGPPEKAPVPPLRKHPPSFAVILFLVNLTLVSGPSQPSSSRSSPVGSIRKVLDPTHVSGGHDSAEISARCPARRKSANHLL